MQVIVLSVCYCFWNQIYESINKNPGYYMSISEQKLLAHFVSEMQNGTRLTMGPSDELDFEMTHSSKFAL